MTPLKIKIHKPPSLKVNLLKPASLLVKLPEAIVIYSGNDLPKYDGEHVITPSAESEQILKTADKHVQNDITVKKIPYYEIDNTAGGMTIYIGTDEELIIEQ